MIVDGFVYLITIPNILLFTYYLCSVMYVLLLFDI